MDRRSRLIVLLLASAVLLATPSAATTISITGLARHGGRRRRRRRPGWHGGAGGDGQDVTADRRHARREQHRDRDRRSGRQRVAAGGDRRARGRRWRRWRRRRRGRRRDRARDRERRVLGHVRRRSRSIEAGRLRRAWGTGGGVFGTSRVAPVWRGELRGGDLDTDRSRWRLPPATAGGFSPAVSDRDQRQDDRNTVPRECGRRGDRALRPLWRVPGATSAAIAAGAARTTASRCDGDSVCAMLRRRVRRRRRAAAPIRACGVPRAHGDAAARIAETPTGERRTPDPVGKRVRVGTPGRRAGRTPREGIRRAVAT